MLLNTPQSQQGGIRLNEYGGVYTTNDSGMGYLVQPWCLTMKPYRISWVLAD
jgi:hypothetical protein